MISTEAMVGGEFPGQDLHLFLVAAGLAAGVGGGDGDDVGAFIQVPEVGEAALGVEGGVQLEHALDVALDGHGQDVKGVLFVGHAALELDGFVREVALALEGIRQGDVRWSVGSHGKGDRVGPRGIAGVGYFQAHAHRPRGEGGLALGGAVFCGNHVRTDRLAVHAPGRDQLILAVVGVRHLAQEHGADLLHHL